jgi:hypothetical protein
VDARAIFNVRIEDVSVHGFLEREELEGALIGLGDRETAPKGMRVVELVSEAESPDAAGSAQPPRPVSNISPKPRRSRGVRRGLLWNGQLVETAAIRTRRAKNRGCRYVRIVIKNGFTDPPPQPYSAQAL